MGFKLKYSDISNFEFQKIADKLNRAPTDGFTAYRIKKISSKIKEARRQISEEYKKDIIEKYAKRDEKGEYNPEDFVPDETKMEEFKKEQESFGSREFFIDRHPLTIADIKDIKISAHEQEALGEMFDDSDVESKEARQLMQSLK